MRSNLSGYSQGIYVAKGIGIILVVVGHYLPGFPNYRIPHYWHWLVEFVYTFHMPLFMFLSGFLYAAAKPVDSFNQYMSLIASKAGRLLIPFISVMLIMFFLKFPGGLFFKLKAPVTIVTMENIILDPLHSFAPFTWFLYVLFEVFVLHGLCTLLITNELYILILSIILFLLPSPEIFMIRTLLFYFPIFIVGFMWFKYDLFNKAYYNIGLISLMIFTILIFTTNFGYNMHMFQRIYGLIMGLLGSISTFFVAVQISKIDSPLTRSLKYIGIYSITIYLFHNAIMGPLEIFLLLLIKISDYWFTITALTIISFAVMLPIFIERYVIRPLPILSKAILGMKT